MDIYGYHPGYQPGYLWISIIFNPGYLWMSPWISMMLLPKKAGNPSPYQAASWWWELVDLDVQWPYTLQQQVGRPWVLKGAKIRVFGLINCAKS